MSSLRKLRIIRTFFYKRTFLYPKKINIDCIYYTSFRIENVKPLNFRTPGMTFDLTDDFFGKLISYGTISQLQFKAHSL